MAGKRHYEAPDMAGFVRRVARAMVRRAAEGDLEALSALVEIRRATDAAINDAARALHAEGHSWTDIARELGTTRQNARQRFSNDTARLASTS